MMFSLETLWRIRQALQCSDPTCECHHKLGEEKWREWYATHCPIDEDDKPRVLLMAGAYHLFVSCKGSCGGCVWIEVSACAGVEMLKALHEIVRESLMKEPLPKGLGKGLGLNLSAPTAVHAGGKEE